MEVTIDPAEVAVTDTFGSGAGLRLVRGMAVAPNGDVLITYLNLVGSQTVSLYDATTGTVVDDDIYPANAFSLNRCAEDVAVDENNLTYVANPATQTVDVYGIGGGNPACRPRRRHTRRAVHQFGRQRSVCTRTSGFTTRTQMME